MAARCSADVASAVEATTDELEPFLTGPKAQQNMLLNGARRQAAVRLFAEAAQLLAAEGGGGAPLLARLADVTCTWERGDARNMGIARGSEGEEGWSWEGGRVRGRGLTWPLTRRAPRRGARLASVRRALLAQRSACPTPCAPASRC